MYFKIFKTSISIMEILLMTFFTSVYAQDIQQENIENKSIDTNLVPKSSKQLDENFSQILRSNKILTANLGMAYNLVGPVNTLDVGIFLDNNSLLGLELGYAKDSNEKGEIEKTLGMFYKQFTGNSFYIRFGLFYEKLKSSKYVIYSETQNSVLADARIGNQWQWQTITLGIDWIGVYQRALVVKEFEYSKNNSKYGVTFLNFYAGFSF